MCNDQYYVEHLFFDPIVLSMNCIPSFFHTDYMDLKKVQGLAKIDSLFVHLFNAVEAIQFVSMAISATQNGKSLLYTEVSLHDNIQIILNC